MGTAEIQLHCIGFGFIHGGENVFPRHFLAGHHKGDNHGAVRPFPFYLLYFLQVFLQRAISDEFDVIEAQKPAISAVNCAITGAVYIDDGRALFAQGFPHHAAPARLEGAHHIVFLVGRRR